MAEIKHHAEIVEFLLPLNNSDYFFSLLDELNAASLSSGRDRELSHTGLNTVISKLT